MSSRHLATTAILGILAGAACGGASQHPAAAPPATSAEPGSARNGCGNHPAGACAAADDAKAPAREAGPLAIARTETIPPGKQVEINLTFATTSSVKATFKASAPVGWNVHSHPHGEMKVHEKGTGAAAEVAFQAPSAGTYSFLWTNDGPAPVTLDVKITGDRGVSEPRR